MNTRHESVESELSVRAWRFDGVYAERELVDALFAKDVVQLTREDGSTLRFLANQVTPSDDTDREQRNFALPDGTLLVIDTPQRAPIAAPRDSKIERWIKSKGATLFSVFAVLVLPAALLTVVIPGAVNLAAPHIPLTWETALGETVFSSLMKTQFQPSDLSSEHKARLTARFDELKASVGLGSARLEFAGGIPNAFALPGGIVVITDQMVQLLDNDDRVAAVLAHELGHVANRHGLRGIATHTIAAQVLTVALTHDQLSQRVVDLVAQRALTARYSQQSEREADRFACELLVKTQRSARSLAETFERFYVLAERYNVNLDSGSYTSTHPPVDTRIAALRACAKELEAAR